MTNKKEPKVGDIVYVYYRDSEDGQEKHVPCRVIEVTENYVRMQEDKTLPLGPDSWDDWDDCDDWIDPD